MPIRRIKESGINIHTYETFDRHSHTEAGLRLRYEIQREFAPYIGVTREKTFGNTRDFNPTNETNFLVGMRFWF